MIIPVAFYAGSHIFPERAVIADARGAAEDYLRIHKITRAQIVSTHVNAASVAIVVDDHPVLYYEYTLTLILDVPDTEAAP